MAQESGQTEVGAVRELRSKFRRRETVSAADRRLPVGAPPPDHRDVVELGETIRTPPKPTPADVGNAANRPSTRWRAGWVWFC